jgi:signal recognition particle subunit SRP54
MFDSLSDRLSATFDRLRGRGALTEADVRGAMREVRIALLEADVALPVVREFVDKARTCCGRSRPASRSSRSSMTN